MTLQACHKLSMFICIICSQEITKSNFHAWYTGATRRSSFRSTDCERHRWRPKRSMSDVFKSHNLSTCLSLWASLVYCKWLKPCTCKDHLFNRRNFIFVNLRHIRWGNNKLVKDRANLVNDLFEQLQKWFLPLTKCSLKFLIFLRSNPNVQSLKLFIAIYKIVQLSALFTLA